MRLCKWPILLVAVILMVIWGSVTGSAANDPPEIRAGSELDFRPFVYRDKVGRPTGFGVELLKAVSDKMGLRIRITPGQWDQVWNGLVAGQLDVLPVVARTPGREPLVDFSLPHTETFDAFFVREGRSAFSNLAAAAGKEIVVLRSDAAHHELVERKFAGKVIPVESIPEGLRLIAEGRHDAFLCSKLVGELEREGADIKGVKSGPPIPDYKRVFSFAVKKGDAELLEKLNQGLLIVKTDGTYDRIYEKWLSADDPWRKYERYLLPAGAGAIAVVLAAGIWLATLRRMVKARTEEIKKLNLELEQRVIERTKKLRESENQFRTSLETMLTGFAILSSIRDEAGRIVDFRYEYINEAGCRLNGRSREETIGRTFTELFPELKGKGAGLFSEYVETAETGKPLDRRSVTYEGVFAGRDAASFVFDVKAVKMGDGIAVSWMDVTSLTKSSEALRQKAEELETLLESVPALVYIAHDPEGRHITGNRAAGEFLQLSERAEVSLNAPPEQQQPAYRTKKDGRVLGIRELPMQRAARGDAVSGVEYDVELGDGTVRHIMANAAPLYDDKGKPRGAVGAFVDITERKRAEDKLRASEERFRVAQELSPDGFSILRPVRDSEGRVVDFTWVYANAATERIVGMKLTALAGRSLLELFPGHRGSPFLETYRQVAETRQTRIEESLYQSDGFLPQRWFRVAVVSTGQNIAVLSQDISDRKRYEERLKASIAEKENLLQEVSHRTKNNMQVISGLLNLQATRSNEDRVKDALVEAQDRIQAMALVHEKLYKGGSIYALSIKEYGEDLANNLLKSHQGSKGPVRLVLELEDIKLPYDMVLPSGLIVNELISNSLKHAFPNRKPGNIFLSLRRNGEKLELRYKDDGPGLPEGIDLSRIETLGLKLVHSLAVHQLRGSIELVHNPGTEFLFRFRQRTIKVVPLGH